MAFPTTVGAALRDRGATVGFLRIGASVERSTEASASTILLDGDCVRDTLYLDGASVGGRITTGRFGGTERGRRVGARLLPSRRMIGMRLGAFVVTSNVSFSFEALLHGKSSVPIATTK